MNLYIANCSMQNISFVYRIPGNPSPRTQIIPIGQQVKISGELTSDEIDSIIDQHRVYGLVDVKEIERVRGKFGGMCYSIGSPVSSDKLGYARQIKIESLVEQGKKIRQEAAISVSNQIEENLEGNMNLNGLEMTIQEEDRKLSADEEGGKRIAEGIRVRRDAEPTNEEPAVSRGRGRPKKAA